MLTVLLTLVIVGVVLFLVDAYIPMDAAVRAVLRAVVVILLILWLCSVFGLTGLPRLRL